ncbi:U-exon, partial [Lizard adenovirus 2]
MTEVRLNGKTLMILEEQTPSWKWIKVARQTDLKMFNLPGVKIFRGHQENEETDKHNL